MNLPEAKRIFFIGIGGSGMSGLAYLLATEGKEVAGCDQDPAASVPAPLALVTGQAIVEAIGRAEVVVYSDAVPADNPDRLRAIEKHIPTLPYQEALGEFARRFAVLAVTGAHGKSSTSAFLAHILVEAGLDPTALIGAPVISWGRRGARAGKGEYLVVEADEYRNHFLALHPQVAVITTIDFDHPDFFQSLADVEVSYKQFLAGVQEGGMVITLASEYQKRPAGFWPETTIQVSDEAAQEIDVPIPGDHMKRNAALAVAAAQHVGVSATVARAALKTFGGLGRRFEKLGELDGKPVFSDYGHHPAEIAATIRGIRHQFPDKRLLVVFEAHMIERVRAFFNEFVLALDLADGVIICPVFYPRGREGEREAVEGKIRAALTTAGVVLESYDSLRDVLSSQLPAFDLACAFTAGVLDGKMRKIIT